MTHDTHPITAILCERPSQTGSIPRRDGKTPVPYRIDLLPPGAMNELRIQRHAYLAERGIEDCTPATAEIYDRDLELRVLAEAVRHPTTGEPLAPLDEWRETQGAAVRTCLDHYTQLEALAEAIDMGRAAELAQLAAHVRQEAGPGRAAFWATVDYETLLACFVALSLAHDQTRAELASTRAR